MSEQETIKRVEAARYSLLTLMDAYKSASPSVDKNRLKAEIANATTDLNASIKEFLAIEAIAHC